MTQALQSIYPLPIQQEEASVQKLTVTDSAADKVWELIQEEGDLQLKLRVFITGAGCSGFQYGFTFDTLVNPDDEVVIKEPPEDTLPPSGNEQGRRGRISLLIDPVSLGYLEGAEVDYKSDLSGERFIIRNPNAKTTCGCGSSFSV